MNYISVSGQGKKILEIQCLEGQTSSALGE